MTKNALVLPGDGIGPEVTHQVERIIDWLNESHNTGFVVDKALIGGSAYDETGSPLPEDTITKAKASDAVLLVPCL